MSLMNKFQSLRKKFPEFIYDSFKLTLEKGDLTVKYKFIQSQELVFEPFIIFKDCYISQQMVSEMNSAFFNLGMIELASYYKACCSPKIRIRAGHLNSEQISFWKTIIYRGLGEFLFINDIETSENEMFEFVIDNEEVYAPSTSNLKDEVIIPVGGGKDSVVTLEILSELKGLPLILNPREASTESVRIAGYSRYLKIERTIDPLLIELNKKGFLNGHTPFSALLSFVSAVASIISGKKHIALSNENSANEGNAFFSGIEVNHQYSKSYEAEVSLHNYIRKYISSDTNYFSFLRPLNEIAIAKLFSDYKKHFSSFRSCNAGSKENKWCVKCPKCLFTYIILSPFIADEELKIIFGSDLLNDRELEHSFLELCGLQGIKPFECVGTVTEIKAALAKKASFYEGSDLPYLLDLFIKNSGDKIGSYFNDFNTLINDFSDKNLLTSNFKKLLEINL